MGIHGMTSYLPYRTNVCVLDFRTHECFLAFHFQQISMIYFPCSFFRTVGMIRSFHHLHIAIWPLLPYFLPLTALLSSLLAIRFNNASCIADEITRKLTNTKRTLLVSLVIWKVVSFFISISKSLQICKKKL